MYKPTSYSYLKISDGNPNSLATLLDHGPLVSVNSSKTIHDVATHEGSNTRLIKLLNSGLTKCTQFGPWQNRLFGC